MADIMMCMGENCKDKTTCYRFLAEANKYRQAYYPVSPSVLSEQCDFYIDARPTENEKTKCCNGNCNQGRNCPKRIDWSAS